MEGWRGRPDNREECRFVCGTVANISDSKVCRLCFYRGKVNITDGQFGSSCVLKLVAIALLGGFYNPYWARCSGLSRGLSLTVPIISSMS